MSWYENRRGENLWYEDHGAGCPVVLLHGWCMSSAVWKYQFEGLTDSCRVIAPDLRGHGRSREISTDLTFGRFAEDLADLFEYLDLQSAVIVGWSMGGQIALHASAALSDRLSGMVLVSATPRFTASDDFPHGLAAQEASGMALKVKRSLKRALDGFFSRLFVEGELDEDAAKEIGQLLASITPPETCAVLEALDALVTADMRDLLAGSAVPTFIINGNKDRICLPSASDYLKEHIPGAEQTVLSNCGHAPFLSHRYQFNAEIIRFTGSVCAQNA